MFFINTHLNLSALVDKGLDPNFETDFPQLQLDLDPEWEALKQQNQKLLTKGKHMFLLI
jgi:hypothetical protein